MFKTLTFDTQTINGSIAEVLHENHRTDIKRRVVGRSAKQRIKREDKILDEVGVDQIDFKKSSLERRIL